MSLFHSDSLVVWFVCFGFAAQLFWGLLMTEFGAFWLLAPIHWAAKLLAPLGSLWRRLCRAWGAFQGDEPSPTGYAQDIAPEVAPLITPSGGGWDRYELRPDGSQVWEMGGGSGTNGNAEVEHLRERVAALVRDKQQLQADALHGPAVARLTGRVARVEVKPEGSSAAVWLAVQDGEERHQAIKLRADLKALDVVTEGASVRVTAVWEHGRLTLDAIERAEVTTEPMPEVNLPDKMAGKVPEWFDSKAKNARRDLLKASDGSSSVSDLKVHIVFATKRRGKVLTAPMVERIKTLVAEVVEAKKLGRLLAVNAEADHVHIALWLPVNVAASDAMGQIKSFTSRLLRKEFPALLEHHTDALWQRGGFCGGIGNGGDLSAVLNYIANQDAPQALQGDQEATLDDKEDQTDVSA